MAKSTLRTAAAVLFCFLQVLSGQQKPSELVGRWRGTIETPLFDVPFVLTISRSGEHYSGAINGSFLRKFRVMGDAFEFEFKADLDVWKGKTTFKGKLNEDHSSITGMLPGTLFRPIRLQRDPASKSNIDIRVPIGPTAFRRQGMTHLVYELDVTNFGPDAVDVKRIEVLGDIPMTVFAGGDLKRMLSQTHLNPDATSMAYMWITLPVGAAAPLDSPIGSGSIIRFSTGLK